MGFFDRLFGKKGGDDKKQAEAAAPEPPPAPDPPPDAVIVLREGMRVPAGDYVLAVARASWPELPDDLPQMGLSQPRWFKPGEFTESGVADAVLACAARLGLADPDHRHRETNGPDGARVMLVELRRR